MACSNITENPPYEKTHTEDRFAYDLLKINIQIREKH